MSATNPPYRIFIIRPWHLPASKLHRHLDDGVEHVAEVIAAIQDAAKLHNARMTDSSIEIVFDENTMSPGTTILEQLYVALQACDLTVVLLDGLRPNVVFEYGLVLGMLKAKGEAEARVLGLRANDATVLVRNFYETPSRVPTYGGQDADIINPALDINRHFSDIAGLFLHHYDRHQILRTVRDWFQAHFNRELQRAGEPRAIVAGAAEVDVQTNAVNPTTPKSSTSDIWELYRAGRYDQIVQRSESLRSADERKVLALAYMKSSRVHDAIRVWVYLDAMVAGDNSLTAMAYSVKLHLGICQYIVGRYQDAEILLSKAVTLANEKGKLKAELWLKRAKEKYVSAGGSLAVEACSVAEKSSEDTS